MELNISDLTWDRSVYPRENKSQKTVEAYVEALSSGAQFPAIKVQKVFNYPNGDKPRSKKTDATIILDGIHRWSAFREKGLNKIPVIEWKKRPLDYEKNRTQLLLEGAGCNLTHGDRLTQTDKKRISRDIAFADPDLKWTEAALAEKLGVTQPTINKWIADIRARQKAGRNSIILRLHKLGLSHEVIAKKVGLERSAISKIVKNIKNYNFHNLLSQGHDMDYIASHYHMDLALAWALRLEGMTDQERFRELGWGLRTWDHWNFNECDERFGDDWPGRIPAQLVAHTLFYFTKPGDLVLDPMAGGGVVSDVCLLFGRKCRSFDIATSENRPEIQYHQWDTEDNGWPVSRNTDLIFVDPPYFQKMDREYREKAPLKTTPISSYSKKEYMEFFKGFFKLAKANTARTSRIAFLNADWRDFESTAALKEKPDNSITIFDYHRLLSKTGWRVTHRIECPLSSERMNGIQVNRMQVKRILGTVGRTLLIAKKETNNN